MNSEGHDEVRRFRIVASLAALLAVVCLGAGLYAGHYGLFPMPQLISARFTIERWLNGSAEGLVANADAIDDARADYWLSGPVDVAMVGDSITARARWHEMFPAVLIVNRGIDGDTVEGVHRRLEHLIALRPRKIFLMIGINDLAAGNDPSAIARKYDKILGALTPRGEVYVQSVLACSEPLCGRKMNERVRELNTVLARIARERGAQFIDLNLVFAPDAILRSDLTRDGVHLNAKGYQLWRKQIAILICPDAECRVAGGASPTSN